MRSFVYSRWDGSQAEFRPDARRSLDALSRWLFEGLGTREALERMRRQGFELAGLDMRVMGLDELVEELRQEVEALFSRWRMDEALCGPRERLERLLDREQAALGRSFGFESARMNEFLSRRFADAASLADRIERFRDHRFEDPEAGREWRELARELERLRALERFLARRGGRFRGPEPADYETAQRVRERIEALERLGRDLAAGNFETVSPDELRELLGGAAADSLVWLRDLEPGLEREGFLRASDGRIELTPRAIRRIGAFALAEVYGALRRDRAGGHPSDARGVVLPRPDETRAWEFGDPFDLDVVRTLLRALRRRPAGASGEIPLEVEDFELREMDHATHATTVLLLDLSWSMSWAGRFPAAKRVALALDHLVRTRFPRDHFFVVGFSTRARQIRPRDLPEVVWDMGEPFTNLQEGLILAERLIARYPSASPQVLVVTDGQPTAYFRGRQLRVEWPMGFGGVSPHAVAETMKQVRRLTRRGITINTFMLDDSPELLGFVEHMTQVNRGRAFYTEPRQLGSYVMVDYLRGRRRKRG
jgi:uncharacterized protein with von Willebrand factor type A (vWA) domain